MPNQNFFMKSGPVSAAHSCSGVVRMKVTYTKVVPAASVMVFSFQLPLEFRECAQAWPLELANPALGNLVDRHRVYEVKLFAPLSLPRHEVRILQNRQMLRDRLARHVQSLA